MARCYDLCRNESMSAPDARCIHETYVTFLCRTHLPLFDAHLRLHGRSLLSPGHTRRGTRLEPDRQTSLACSECQLWELPETRFHLVDPPILSSLLKAWIQIRPYDTLI